MKPEQVVLGGIGLIRSLEFESLAMNSQMSSLGPNSFHSGAMLYIYTTVTEWIQVTKRYV